MTISIEVVPGDLAQFIEYESPVYRTPDMKCEPHGDILTGELLFVISVQISDDIWSNCFKHNARRTRSFCVTPRIMGWAYVDSDEVALRVNRT